MATGAGELLAGRYRLLEVLGRGGMGAVWRGHDEDLDREVVVKQLTLPDHLGGEDRQALYARMRREARAAARLKHPGVVTVYDQVVEDDGRPWIVMELIHGPSLARVLTGRGRLPAGRVAEIGVQMLAALAAAHAAGITHRDVKPANVLLEGDRVVLTDFGIATVEGEATLTGSGVVLGTPAFMSPEQLNGAPATPASDLWSLGATLYAAVEGRRPFSAPTPAALYAAIATRPPDPVVHAGPLRPVLEGLLRKDPALRLTGDRAMASLRAIAAGRPVDGAAAGPRPYGDGTQSDRRHAYVAGPPPPLPPTGPPPAVSSGPPPVGSGAVTPRAMADPALPGTAPPGDRRHGTQARARGTVLMLLSAAALAAVAALVYLPSLLSPEDGPGAGGGGQPGPGTRAGRSTQIAGIARLAGPADTVESVAFSPDGRILASGGDTVRLWDVRTRRLIGGPLGGHEFTVHSVAFSPDGKILASGGLDDTIRLWDVATRRPLGGPLTGHDSVESVAFSPDGTLLASAGRDDTVRLWDVRTRRPVGKPLTGHTFQVYSVAFSPDGKILASGSGDETIRLWDVATRRQIGGSLTGHTDYVRSVVFSPDGRTLASGGNDNTVILWDVASRRPLGGPLTGHTHFVGAVAFSPDGRTLAAGDGTGQVWDVRTRRRIGGPLAGHTDTLYAAAFSPDGRLLATGSADKTIRLWDTSPLT